MRLSHLRIGGLFDDLVYQEGSYPNIRILAWGKLARDQNNNAKIDLWLMFMYRVFV